MKRSIMDFREDHTTQQAPEKPHLNIRVGRRQFLGHLASLTGGLALSANSRTALAALNETGTLSTNSTIRRASKPDTMINRPIDRLQLVQRHNPQVQAIDPFAALSIGNGNFAFTADVTGLQTFPEGYKRDFPLCTTSHWAWHSVPLPDGVKVADFQYENFDTYGRPVPYPTNPKGQEPLYNWLRENPHRLHLEGVRDLVVRPRKCNARRIRRM